MRKVSEACSGELLLLDHSGEDRFGVGKFILEEVCAVIIHLQPGFTRR